MRGCLVASALTIAFVMATAVVHADTITPRAIVAFRVEGDSKLAERTLGYLAHVEIGDRVSDADIPRLVQSLISSELFRKVAVRFEETPEGVVVVATLDDKHSWIIAPTLYILPGKRAVGLGFAENNFRGRNQKLLLYGQLGNRESLFFGTYLDPQVQGTRLIYRFDLYTYRRVNDEYDNPVDDPSSETVLRTSTATYVGGGALVGWTFRWWLVADLRLRGAFLRYKDSHGPDDGPLPAPQNNGWDVSAQARITIDRRGYHFGVRWGPYLQLQVESSIPGLDDYNYRTAMMRAYYSWRLFGEHQLEFRTLLNVGSNLPFHDELTLGGTTDLRGYNLDQFRGDTRAVFRSEYSVPIGKWKFFAFRAIGFWDSAYIGFHFPRTGGDRNYFFPSQERGAHWWRNDVGAGLRIFVKAVVLPLLGLDFAYGLEGHSPEVWLQVGITDF